MNKRVDWIDIAKGLSILLVICGHNTFVAPGRGVIFNKIIGVYDMPLFFITAGYFARKKNIRDYIVKSFHRLIIPYLFTAMLLIAVSVLRGVLNGGIPYTISEYLISWVCGYGFNAYENIMGFGALWFLTAIFCSNIIFNFLLGIAKDDRVLCLCSCTISAVGVIISRFVYLPFNLDIGMYAVVFCFFGYSLNKYWNQESKNRQFIALIVAIVCFLGGVYVYSYDLNTRHYSYPIISTIGAIGGSALFFMISNCLDKVKYVSNMLCWCGKNSLTILCLHILEHSVIPWSKLTILYGNYYLLVTTKITLIIIGTFVVMKLPIVKSIYGYKNT